MPRKETRTTLLFDANYKSRTIDLGFISYRVEHGQVEVATEHVTQLVTLGLTDPNEQPDQKPKPTPEK